MSRARNSFHPCRFAISSRTLGAEFTLRDVFQARHSHTYSQDLRLHGSCQERLVSFIYGELNPQFASLRERIRGVRMLADLETHLLEVGGERGRLAAIDCLIGGLAVNCYLEPGLSTHRPPAQSQNDDAASGRHDKRGLWQQLSAVHHERLSSDERPTVTRQQ